MYNEHIGLRGSRRRFSRPSDVCCRLLSITEQTKWLSEYNLNGRLQERINVVTGCEISRQKTQFVSSFLRQILKCWRVNHVWIMYEIGALRYSTADQRPHRCCPVRIKLKILTASKSRCASSKVSHPVGGEIRARSQYVAAQVYTTNGSLIASAQGRI